MSVILLPLKVALLIAILFVEDAETIMLISGVILVLVLLPKTKRASNAFFHSGYMRSTDGQIYIVKGGSRAKAASMGFKELTILQTYFLKESYPTWEE